MVCTTNGNFKSHKVRCEACQNSRGTEILERYLTGPTKAEEKET